MRDFFEKNPEVSKFNFNQDFIALWVRSSSYFVISKNIQFDEILSKVEFTKSWVVGYNLL